MYYHLELTNSIGRTGNCMVCVINAINHALQTDIQTISFDSMCWQSNALLPGKSSHSTKENTLLNSMNIGIINKSNSGKKATSKGCVNWNKNKKQYESWFSGFYNGDTCFEDRINIVQKYIRPLFTFKEHTLNDDDLVIHLRSGDIFSLRPHYAYIQPPLSFYIEIIENSKWNKIYVITEKDDSPIYKKLRELYPNIITFLEKPENRHGGNGWGFKQDLEYLVGAVNYVPCQSSLCPLIIQLSKTIKNVYMPSYMFKTRGHHAIGEHSTWWSNSLRDKKGEFSIKNINFHVSDYDEYINTPDPIFNYNEKKYIDYLMQYKNSS